MSNQTLTAQERAQIEARILVLETEHHDLDDIIARLALDPAQDQLQLRRLKKKKLQLKDLIARLHFDGAFQLHGKGVVVAANQSEPEDAAQKWLNQTLANKTSRSEVAELLLQTWWCLTENKSFAEKLPSEAERRDGWRKAVNSRTVEICWLARQSARLTHYEELSLTQLGL